MVTVVLTSKTTGEATVCFSGFIISPFSKQKIKCHLLNFHVGHLIWQWCLEEQQPCLWEALDPSSTFFLCPHHVVCSLHIIVLPWVDWNLSLHLLCFILFFFFFSDICLHRLSRAHSKTCCLVCLPEKVELIDFHTDTSTWWCSYQEPRTYSVTGWIHDATWEGSA